VVTGVVETGVACFGPTYRGSGPMIRLDGVSKRFPDDTVAVPELTLEVPEGEICVLVGPSGYDSLENVPTAMLFSDYRWVAVVEGERYVGVLTPAAGCRATSREATSA